MLTVLLSCPAAGGTRTQRRREQSVENEPLAAESAPDRLHASAWLPVL